MRLAASGGRSLLAQSVQLNVSPTYAEPNDTGRLRIGLSRKASGFVFEAERYASEAGAAGGLVLGGDSGGSIGYCVTSDGCESLRRCFGPG